jgi:hypothetical protein
MRTLNELYDMYPDENFLVMDGFDNAVLGVEDRTMRLVYSKSKIIKHLLKEMDYETAMEYFDYNIEGAWMGDKTPIIVNDMFYTSGI